MAEVITEKPRIAITKNKEADWFPKHLAIKYKSIKATKKGLQLKRGSTTTTLSFGKKIEFVDDHGFQTITLLSITANKAFFSYYSEFDHSSFGKNLISKDSGTFEFTLPKIKK